MQKYRYSARDVNGKVVEGEIEAKDDVSVADILHDRGLIVVSIKEGFGLDLEKLNEINIGGVPMKDKVVFMRQMATMVGSGLPLTRALEIMHMQASNPLSPPYVPAPPRSGSPRSAGDLLIRPAPSDCFNNAVC